MTSKYKLALKTALRPVAQALTVREPKILMYHRFADMHGGRALGIDTFRRQIEMLKKDFTLLTMRELVRRCASRSVGERNIAAITVDDGYADFHTHAFPVLRELEVPATIFAVGGFVSRELWLWPDQLRAVIYNSEPGNYRLSGFWNGATAEYSNDDEREESWSRLADMLLPESTATRYDAIQSMAETLDVDIDTLDMSAFEPLSWDQLRELDAAGIEIGDHTWSHCNVARNSKRAIIEELARSREALETNIGTKIAGFAYPNGTREDYDSVAAQTVRELGFEYAVVAHPRRFHRNCLYEIGRFDGTGRMPTFRNVIAGFELLRTSARA